MNHSVGLMTNLIGGSYRWWQWQWFLMLSHQSRKKYNG